MMISDEQARLAARTLRGRHPSDGTLPESHVPQEVIDAAFAVASHAPDVRYDRIAEARARLDMGCVDAHRVAEMMLSRIAGDAVR